MFYVKMKSFCLLSLILFIILVSIHHIGGNGIRIPLSIREHESNYNLDFYGTISIGTPPQKINISFGFSSEYIRVPSSNCSSSACRDQNNGTYNHKDSKTFRSLDYNPKSWRSIVIGPPATETITVGNTHIQNASFFISETVTYRDNSSYYGDAGLGYNSTLLRLCEEIGLKKKFSFYTDYPWNNNTSELMLCDIDETKFRGNLRYVNATPTQTNVTSVFPGLEIADRDWHITMQSVLLEYNGESVPIMESPADFELSPLSPFIIGPRQYIEKIFKALNVTRREYSELREVDCKTIHTLPSIIFRTAGMNFTLTGNEYIRQMTQNDRRVCQVRLQAWYGDTDYWYIGNVFNRKYYTVFDMDMDRIGFAKSIHGSASTAINNQVLLMTVFVFSVLH